MTDGPRGVQRSRGVKRDAQRLGGDVLVLSVCVAQAHIPAVLLLVHMVPDQLASLRPRQAGQVDAVHAHIVQKHVEIGAHVALNLPDIAVHARTGQQDHNQQHLDQLPLEAALLARLPGLPAGIPRRPGRLGAARRPRGAPLLRLGGPGLARRRHIPVALRIIVAALCLPRLGTVSLVIHPAAPFASGLTA